MILLIPQVTIPNNYEYISGTVNGADTIFIADTIISGLCLCSCEESSTYTCVINFYDAQDTIISTETSTITQNANKFVIDRTQADVDYAKRLKAEGRATTVEDLKGCLNLSDFQRMTDNFEILGVLDDETLEITTIPDILDTFFFDPVENNLEIIKETPYQLGNSPEIPERPYNTWQKWNDLEGILWDNFDIRTSRFKYYGEELYIRENILPYPFIYTYGGVIYVSTKDQWLYYPITILNGNNVVDTLLEIQNMLGYEYVETTNIRIVDGSDTIRIVDNTNIIRKVDN